MSMSQTHKKQNQINNEHSATFEIFLICILVLVHTAIIRPQEELPETRDTGDLDKDFRIIY